MIGSKFRFLREQLVEQIAQAWNILHGCGQYLHLWSLSVTGLRTFDFPSDVHDSFLWLRSLNKPLCPKCCSMFGQISFIFLHITIADMSEFI
jgi:hypothetical protein